MNVCMFGGTGRGWGVCLAWLSIAVSSSLGHAKANLSRAQGALMTKIVPGIKEDSSFLEHAKYSTDAVELPPTSFYRQEGKEGDVTQDWLLY